MPNRRRSGGSFRNWLLLPVRLVLAMAIATSGSVEAAGPGPQEGGRRQETDPTPTPGEDKVEPGLRNTILAAPEGQADFLVYLTEQADLQDAYRIEDWAARGQFVLDALRETARTSQSGLLQSLSAQRAAGEVVQFHSFFIINAIGVRGGV